MTSKDQTRETGPWEAALAQIREWDSEWADTSLKVTTNPWNSGVLPRKTVELISLAMNAACTNLNPDGTRRHIRAALEAARDEVAHRRAEQNSDRQRERPDERRQKEQEHHRHILIALESDVVACPNLQVILPCEMHPISPEVRLGS